MPTGDLYARQLVLRSYAGVGAWAPGVVAPRLEAGVLEMTDPGQAAELEAAVPYAGRVALATTRKA